MAILGIHVFGGVDVLFFNPPEVDGSISSNFVLGFPGMATTLRTDFCTLELLFDKLDEALGCRGRIKAQKVRSVPKK